MNIKGILLLGGRASAGRQKATCKMRAFECSLASNSSEQLHSGTYCNIIIRARKGASRFLSFTLPPKFETSGETDGREKRPDHCHHHYSCLDLISAERSHSSSVPRSEALLLNPVHWGITAGHEQEGIFLTQPCCCAAASWGGCCHGGICGRRGALSAVAST